MECIFYQLQNNILSSHKDMFFNSISVILLGVVVFYAIQAYIYFSSPPCNYFNENHRIFELICNKLITNKENHFKELKLDNVTHFTIYQGGFDIERNVYTKRISMEFTDQDCINEFTQPIVYFEILVYKDCYLIKTACRWNKWRGIRMDTQYIYTHKNKYTDNDKYIAQAGLVMHQLYIDYLTEYKRLKAEYGY